MPLEAGTSSCERFSTSGKTKRSLASTTTRPANTETQPLSTSPAEVRRASSRISDDQFHVVTGELSSESKHLDNQYTEIEVSILTWPIIHVNHLEIMILK